MDFALVVMNGEGPRRSYRISPGKRYVLGRDPECDLPIEDHAASRKQCQFEVRRDKLYLSDLNSTNGTFVNGERVKDRVLNIGDKVRTGSVVFLVQPPGSFTKTATQGLTTDWIESKHSTVTIRAVLFCKACGASLGATPANKEYCPKCADPFLGRLLGLSRVLERLAVGKSSTIYRVEELETGRSFAAKVLSTAVAKDNEVRARFKREWKAAQDLDHPNQVRVFYMGEEEGRPYAVMDLASGWPLSTLVKEGVAIELDRVLSYGMQIAAAIVAAEGKGLCHDNLSPDTVLVGNDDTARVVGFKGSGWSKEAGKRDLFQLGALLCFIMCGRMPELTSTGPHPPVRELLKGTPEAFLKLVEGLTNLKSPTAYTSPLDWLMDALSFAVRRKGRVHLPSSLRGIETLEQLVGKESIELNVSSLATQLRTRLLRGNAPTVPGYRAAWSTHSAGGFASDCVDAIPLWSGGFGLLLASATSGTIGGALMMLLLRATFRALIPEELGPADTLQRVRERFTIDGEEPNVFPAVYAVLDPKTHVLTSCQAGATGPVTWVRSAGVLQPTRAAGTPFGSFPFAPSELREVRIAPGDRTFLLTTGITAEVDPQGQPFGLGGLLRVLKNTERSTLQEQIEAILAAVDAHRGGAPPTMDLTVMGIEREEEGATATAPPEAHGPNPA